MSDSGTTASERREVHFSGRVQGVGFRYTTREIAARFEVAGFVENLPDGRVRLVIEGPSDVLDRFERAIELEMQRHITDKQVAVTAAKNEFTRFEVRQ